MNEERITYFAQTDARNKKVNFGIKAKDRTKHVYVIGKTGMGKSTLLENMAVQDIKNGEGMAFIDPHGKTADLLLEYVPDHRIKDVVYFAPFDTDYPISFNVLESVDPDKRHLVVSGLMSTFKKIWIDAWSARMEYILTNTLLALLEYPDATLLGVNRMLSDKVFRNQVVSHVTDPSVKTFWTQEFANYTERMAAEAVPAIQNKIGQFTSNALIRNMIGQPKSSFNIREMMDQGKLFIINLSKGRVGESNANLLGGMLITKIYLAALSRADVPDRILKTLPNFYLFVDEFQSFANDSFADILSEARKYKLNLTIAHQYIEQMEEKVRAAVFGNVGTMIVFRVGAYDAEVLEKEFLPQFTAEDLVNLGIYQIYLKLMIDGVTSPPFSSTTMPPIAKPEHSNASEVIKTSRLQFASPRADVERVIEEWHAPVKPPLKQNTSKQSDFREQKDIVKPSNTNQNTPQNQDSSKDMQNLASNHIQNNTTSNQISNITKKTENTNQNKNNTDKAPIIQKNNEQKQSPVTLDSLALKNNKKDITPQRVSELKSALASVLNAHKNSKPNNDENKSITNTKIETNNSSKTDKDISNKPITKEISEDVLRDVLKVE